MTYYQDDTVTLHHGDSLDVLRTLADGSVDCCVTSPPYFGLRDYGHPGQIGAEKTPAEFVERLRNDVVWHKLTAMPESVQDRLSNRHEYLFLFVKSKRYHFDLDAIREPHAESTIAAASRARIPYEAPGQRPQTKSRVAPRPQRVRAEQLAREHGLTQAHIDAIRSVGITDTGKATIQTGTGKNRPEIQALADEAKAALGGYYREFLTPAGKNPGDVWSIAAEPFPGAHFATFPSELPRRCIVAGCKPGGTVLDPFHGSGTTGMVATRNGRKYVGIELNQKYIDLSLRTRLADGVLDFDGGAA